MFAQWGGTCWGVVGFAEGSLGGLCCEHCEVDGFQGYGVDGVGFWRIRGSDAEVGCVSLGV